MEHKRIKTAKLPWRRDLKLVKSINKYCKKEVIYEDSVKIASNKINHKHSKSPYANFKFKIPGFIKHN